MGETSASVIVPLYLVLPLPILLQTFTNGDDLDFGSLSSRQIFHAPRESLRNERHWRPTSKGIMEKIRQKNADRPVPASEHRTVGICLLPGGHHVNEESICLQTAGFTAPIAAQSIYCVRPLYVVH